jgi:hypothetical protein
MDWKLGLLFAFIQTIIIVLDWLGVKPNMRRAVNTTGRPSRGTAVLVALFMVATWVAVGLDFYDRRHLTEKLG